MNKIPDQNRGEGGGLSPFARNVWTMVAIVIPVVVLLFLLVQVAQVLLLIFAGILVAVFLRGLARNLQRLAPVGDTAALILVVLLIVGTLMLGGFLLAPNVSAQLAELQETLPEAVDTTRDFLEERGWGRWFLDWTPTMEGIFTNDGDGLERYFGAFATALGALAHTLFILIVGIYLAVQPQLYVKGITLLFPHNRRPRVKQVLDALGETLWSWLVGQFITMLIIGTLTSIALWVIGVPMALALGVIAGLFEFVPIIGPWAAAIPGVLIALSVSPMLGLYAALIYLAVQQLESNLISPLVARRMVSIPPALTVTATILAAVLFGLPGVLLATPLAVAVMVLVRMVYVQGVLGDDVPAVPPLAK